MATIEEKMQILKMLEEGKISADEAAGLLEALGEDSQVRKETGSRESFSEPAGGRGARWFRVMVTDTDTGKSRVNVRLPIGMVRAGMKMGMRFAPEVEGLDLDELTEFLRSGALGKIVDVYDDDDGEHVEVFIE